MSKIEKALEKAIEARGAEAAGAAPQAPHSSPQPSGATEAGVPTFSAGPALVTAAQVNEHIVCITDPYSATAEQYKRLRARIIRETAKDFRNSIMTTSANAGEGKTVTAVNLAVALAQEIDHTVLLVDADLRRPAVHTYLGLAPRCGLADYLQGTVELPDALIKTGIGKLVVLPAGEPPDNPAELLASARMKQLVGELKHRYKDRYLIFDTSPLLLTADTLSLSRYVDGLLFVVQADATPQREVVKALSLVKGVPVLGIVLNDLPAYLAKGGNHYYQYRYGGKRAEQAAGAEQQKR